MELRSDEEEKRKRVERGGRRASYRRGLDYPGFLLTNQRVICSSTTQPRHQVRRVKSTSRRQGLRNGRGSKASAGQQGCATNLATKDRRCSDPMGDENVSRGVQRSQ